MGRLVGNPPRGENPRGIFHSVEPQILYREKNPPFLRPSSTVRGSESMMSNGEMGNKIGEFYWQNRIYQVQIRGEM